MLDINLIRGDPELVKKNQKKRGYDVKDIDTLLKIDKDWKKIKQGNDNLRQQRNKISKQINQAKKQKKNIKALIKKAKQIPKKLQENQKRLREIEEERRNIIVGIPNILDKSVPTGGEEKYKQVGKKGKIPKFKFKIKGHEELLGDLDILDMKRAAKIAGSGFYIFKGQLAQLERALIQFMLDFHVKDGFIEINPPQLVNAKTMFGTGNLPKFEGDLYKTREGLYPIPTAEVPITNLYAKEIINESKLPKKFVSFTQCYRTEAGRHGAETPGIFRLHEFEKVEMVYICKPEDSWKFLEEMTRRAEKIIEMLKLPYRKIILASEDTGFAGAKTYDLEVYSPYLKKYLEASSCSNCTDFQARRMNTRFHNKKTNKMEFVHTLNGSGLATPRLIISIVENYQQKDGSIKVPTVLQKYCGFKKIKKK